MPLMVGNWTPAVSPQIMVRQLTIRWESAPVMKSIASVISILGPPSSHLYPRAQFRLPGQSPSVLAENEANDPLIEDGT